MNHKLDTSNYKRLDDEMNEYEYNNLINLSKYYPQRVWTMLIHKVFKLNLIFNIYTVEPAEIPVSYFKGTYLNLSF